MKTSTWFRIALFNLMIVAILGVVMRYKIPFSIPWLDQKHTLHSHSHFAFTGWISQALMILILAKFNGNEKKISQKHSQLLWLNLISAYGMLVSFLIQGYGFVSIAFSTLAIVVSVIFLIMTIRDIPFKNSAACYALISAGFLNVLSALGPFSLAYLMANNINDQHAYLGSLYFFLHFQYNGWFFLGCLGLLMHFLSPIIQNEKSLKKIVLLFVISSLPAFLLSILWLDLAWYWMVLAGIAVALQLWATALLFNMIFENKKMILAKLNSTSRLLLFLSLFAFGIKILLQSFSLIPSVGDITYGFRPIVIGYLHLVLLGIITLFILGYAMAKEVVPITKTLQRGLVIFVIGIILNEFLLLVHGVSSMQYYAVPYINHALLLAALTMLSGVVVMQLRDS